MMTWLSFQRFYSYCFNYLQFQVGENSYKIFFIFVYVCYLAALQPILGHYRGDSLRFYNSTPKGHFKLRNVVGPLSQSTQSTLSFSNSKSFYYHSILYLLSCVITKSGKFYSASVFLVSSTSSY